MAFVAQWTEEEDDLIRRCAEKGQSPAVAAQMLTDIFGTERSRNSVIGRANRCGIKFARQEASREARAEPKVPQRKATPSKPAMKDIAERLTAPMEAAFVADKVEDPEGPLNPIVAFVATPAEASDEGSVGILFLERRELSQCARPIGDWDVTPVEEKRVCGQPVPIYRQAAGLPWCDDCAKRVFTKAAHKQAPKFFKFNRRAA